MSSEPNMWPDQGVYPPAAIYSIYSIWSNCDHIIFSEINKVFWFICMHWEIGENKSHWFVYVFIDSMVSFPFPDFLWRAVCVGKEKRDQRKEKLLKWIKWEGWRANLREWQKKKEGGKEENRDSRTKLTAPVLSFLSSRSSRLRSTDR